MGYTKKLITALTVLVFVAAACGDDGVDQAVVDEVVDDLIDESIEQAVLSGADIELFRDGSRLDGHRVAALLRF